VDEIRPTIKNALRICRNVCIGETSMQICIGSRQSNRDTAEARRFVAFIGHDRGIPQSQEV